MWHQYEHGERALNRTMRNELRAAHEPALLLPPTVVEATAQASPDAAVWMVGDGVPELRDHGRGTTPVNVARQRRCANR